MKKLIVISFSLTALIVAGFGMAGFALLMRDFHFQPRFHPLQSFQLRNLLFDLLLLLFFALQHSLMARKGFKQWLGRYFPPYLERNLYVLLSGFALLTLSALWQGSFPMIWETAHITLQWILHGIALAGLLLSAWGAIFPDGSGLVGLRQMRDTLLDRVSSEPPLSERAAHRFFRHPIYLGLLLVFWASPSMSADHFMFCTAISLYLFVAVRLEEKDLHERFGKAYAQYCQRVGFFGPKLWRK